MALSETEKAKVLLHLGYPSTVRDRFEFTLGLEDPVFEDQIRAELSTIERMLAELATVEETIEASALGDIALSYSRKVKFLNEQGSRALVTISRILDLPVAYNRFKPQMRDAHHLLYGWWGGYH